MATSFQKQNHGDTETRRKNYKKAKGNDKTICHKALTAPAVKVNKGHLPVTNIKKSCRRKIKKWVGK